MSVDWLLLCGILRDSSWLNYLRWFPVWTKVLLGLRSEGDRRLHARGTHQRTGRALCSALEAPCERSRRPVLGGALYQVSEAPCTKHRRRPVLGGALFQVPEGPCTKHRRRAPCSKPRRKAPCTKPRRKAPCTKHPSLPPWSQRLGAGLVQGASGLARPLAQVPDRVR